MDSNNEIDAIVEQLRADSIPATPQPNASSEPAEKITDENINDYVLKKSVETVEAALDAVQSLKDIVITGQNPQEIGALASLINATSKSIDNLNKLNMQNKNIKNSLKLKQMEVAAVKGLKPPTTNVLIATRDEIMSGAYKTKERVELIQDISPNE
jgi:hypothetical protein